MRVTLETFGIVTMVVYIEVEGISCRYAILNTSGSTWIIAGSGTHREIKICLKVDSGYYIATGRIVFRFEVTSRRNRTEILSLIYPGYKWRENKLGTSTRENSYGPWRPSVRETVKWAAETFARKMKYNSVCNTCKSGVDRARLKSKRSCSQNSTHGRHE